VRRCGRFFHHEPRVIDRNGVHLDVEHVFVDGATAVVELCSTSTTSEGAPFANRYCWVCHFDGDTIVTVRA
jgi:uncharacterized protein